MMSKYINKPIKVTSVEEHEDGSATVQVECDPETFAAIFNVGFVKLIENGLKYNEEDNKTIKITTEETANNIQIKIKDNGIGIHKQYHEQIFSMFKRLHTNHTYEGTGLGLAICKKIVDRMPSTKRVSKWIEESKDIKITVSS